MAQELEHKGQVAARTANAISPMLRNTDPGPIGRDERDPKHAHTGRWPDLIARTSTPVNTTSTISAMSAETRRPIPTIRTAPRPNSNGAISGTTKPGAPRRSAASGHVGSRAFRAPESRKTAPRVTAATATASAERAESAFVEQHRVELISVSVCLEIHNPADHKVVIAGMVDRHPFTFEPRQGAGQDW